MSLSDDINKTSTSLANIKNAIIAKGTTPSGDITTYAAAIGDITTVNNENKTVSPSTTQQSVTHSAGKTGLGTVVVNAVTAAIDSNIVASNIKKNVEILGVQGSYEGQSANITTLSVTPSTTAQTITASGGVDGYSPVKIAPVTASIDSNIIASNIKKNVEILGVQGSYEGSSTLTMKTITENGTYNASSDNADGYSKVTVNVSGGSSLGINREVVNGVYKMPTTSFTFSLPSTATDVGEKALYYAFQGCTGLTGVNLSSLTSVSGSYALDYAFDGCINLVGILDLSSLTSVGGQYSLFYAFNGCTGLTGVNLSSLTTFNGSYELSKAFYGCTGLISIDLRGLSSLSGEQHLSYMCYGCISLESADLSGLVAVQGNSLSNTFNGCVNLSGIDLSDLATVDGINAFGHTFDGCVSLESANFSSLRTIGVNDTSSGYGQFTSCFHNCNSLTSLTFPNLEKIYCNGYSTGSYGTFANNNKVEKMYFPKLDTITYGGNPSSTFKEACKNVFYGCSSLTELHFGAANQAAIEASPGYSTAWGRGAGNVTIYFDL